MSENSMLHKITVAEGESAAEGSYFSHDNGGIEFISNKSDSQPLVSFKDMDGDGDKDIHVASIGNAPSYWIENTIGVEAHSAFTLNIFKHAIPTTIATGHLDGDETLDMVVGYKSGAKILLNKGDWTEKSITSSIANPTTIIIDDVNKDGESDIIIQDDRGVTFYQNVGGAFGAVTMTWPDLSEIPAMSIGAGNSDSSTTLERPFDNFLTSISQHYYNARDGQFAQWVGSAVAASVTFGDLNSDGLQDTLIQDEDGNTVMMAGSGETLFRNHAMEVDSTSAKQSTQMQLGSDTLNQFLQNSGETTATSSSNEKVNSSTNTLPTASNNESRDSTASDTAAQNALTPEAEELPTDDSSEGEKKVGIAPVDPEPVPASWQWDLEDESFDPQFTAEPGQTPDYEGSRYMDLVFTNRGDDFVKTFGGSDGIYTFSGDDTIVSGSGGDYIYSGSGDDVVFAQSGDDLIWADYGDDTIAAGNGDDVVFGEDGDDMLIGQGGNDFMSGGDGNDFLYGGAAQDTLTGNSGDDTMAGGDQDDILIGGSGNDLIFGGMGRDYLEGSSGQDTFYYSSVSESGDCIYAFSSKEDSFEFSFGKDADFHVVQSPYTGTLDSEGSAFIWEEISEGYGKLYFDEDTSTTGDEWLIADIETIDEAQITADDIVIV